MMWRSLFLLGFVVLVFVSQSVVCLQRCYSTSCSLSYNVCIRLCQINEHCCHIRFSPDFINQLSVADLGCGNTSQDISRISSIVPYLDYSCEGDLCNPVDYLTHSIQPLLDIAMILPEDPPPRPRQGYQVCEHYQCSSGDCRADYVFCLVILPTMGYCQAVYIVNTTTMKVELRSKGCQIMNENLVDIISECHIDNHLDSPAGSILECTCTGYLCNQNVTFTNPTRHAQYGARVCQQLNCSHQCKIVHNKPVCQCPKGFRLGVDNHTCEDIDECLSLNGGCTYFCINTPGSYHCDCTRNRYLSQDGKTCKIKEGLVCKKQTCNQATNKCSNTSDQYCFDTVSEELHRDTTFCAAAYVHNGVTWIPNWKQCFYGIAPEFPCVNETRCVLQQIFKNHSFYICCCKSDHCNSHNRVDFPFDQPSSTAVFSSTSTAIPAVTPTFSFKVQAEPSQSIPTVEFVALAVSCIGYITMLGILSSLCLWYLFNKSFATEQYTIEPRNALEEEDDSLRQGEEIQDRPEVSRQSRVFHRKTSTIPSSSNVIELRKVTMKDDGTGQDITGECDTSV